MPKANKTFSLELSAIEKLTALSNYGHKTTLSRTIEILIDAAYQKIQATQAQAKEEADTALSAPAA